MALPDRGRTCCPFQNRVRLDELLGPTLGKIGEAVEHVCLDLVLEPHTPVQLDVTIDSLAQHDLLSFGQGWQFVGGQRYRPLRSGRSYLATYASARFRSRPMWRLHATSWLRYCAEGDSRRGMADSRYQRAGVQRERCRKRSVQSGGDGMAPLHRETRGRWRPVGVHVLCSPEPRLLHPVVEVDEHPCVPCLSPVAWPLANRYRLDACRRCRPLGVQAEAATIRSHGPAIPAARSCYRS